MNKEYTAVPWSLNWPRGFLFRPPDEERSAPVALICRLSRNVMPVCVCVCLCALYVHAPALERTARGNNIPPVSLSED